MTGRLAFIGHGLLALAIVGFAAACGGDDDDDAAGSGGAGAGAGGSTAGKGGSGGSTGGSGGSTGGSGGSMSMVTKDQCVMMAKPKTPNTTMACLECVCGKNAAVIAKVGEAGWKLIECIGAKCDGNGTDTMCIGGMCMAEANMMGIAEATPTGPVFPMCKMECGIGDMAGGDAGTDDAGL